MRIRSVLVVALLAIASPAFAQFSGDRINQILHEIATDCPRAWSNAHREGHPERYDFIIYAVQRLYAASGGTVGGNWRRAVIGDLSMDGISVDGFADGRRFADVIVGAGGTNPMLGYRTPGPDALLRDSAGNYAPHGFVHARDLPAPAVPCSSSGPIDPPPPPPPPTIDLKLVLEAIAALQQLLERLHVKADELAGKLTAHEQTLSTIEGAADAAFKQAQVAADNTRELLNATPTQGCSKEHPDRCPEYEFRVFGSPVIARPRK